MTETEHGLTHEYDHDVVVVGGGPAGCSAGVFTARYGLDTLVFDRGRSSIQQCAHLENYPGFPAGIGIGMLSDLLHDHATEAGCALVPDLVESVERAEPGAGFVVEPQEGESVTTRRVVAATRYDGEYMRGLDDDDAMFETYDHDGETHETFDSEYADHDGTTPVAGLYVASPSTEADRQAIMAAGRGARVGLRVVEDAREARGYPETVSDRYDWMREESALDAEWRDRDRWREWFDEQVPDDALSDERRVALREREIDRWRETYLSEEEIEQRGVRGQQRLLDHIDDELVLDAAREIEAERQATGVSD
jgi:hypothetical protein